MWAQARLKQSEIKKKTVLSSGQEKLKLLLGNYGNNFLDMMTWWCDHIQFKCSQLYICIYSFFYLHVVANQKSVWWVGGGSEKTTSLRINNLMQPSITAKRVFHSVHFTLCLSKMWNGHSCMHTCKCIIHLKSRSQQWVKNVWSRF